MIKESKQVGVVYHFTRLNNFGRIADGNFTIKPQSGKFSLTRNYKLQKTNPFDFKHAIVRIAIDGTKLSDKYEIVPYMDKSKEYYKSITNVPIEMQNSLEAEGYDLKGQVPDDLYRKVGEYEELVYAKGSPKIDIRDCILAIDILDTGVSQTRSYDIEEMIAISKDVSPVKINIVDEWKPYKTKAEPNDGKFYFKNWRIPNVSELSNEYKYEYLQKIAPKLEGEFKLFDGMSEFINKISMATIEPGPIFRTKEPTEIEAYITIVEPKDPRILNRSHCKSMECLMQLIRGYRSYPEYRSEKDVGRIYRGFKNKDILPAPIIIDLLDGTFWCMSGNTRMDVAEILNVETVYVVVVRFPRKDSVEY